MDNIIVVPLPDDAHSCEVVKSNLSGGWCVVYLRGNPDYACEYYQLPPGQYDYLFTWPECSGEDCEKVVYGWPYEGKLFYPEFKTGGFESALYFESAKKSFTSWLRSRGHNPESKFAILKKKV